MASANFMKAREEQATEARRRASKTGRYRVAGRHTVLGVKPGGTVELAADHAARLLQSGNVEEITVQREETADETGHDGPESKE